MSISTTSRVSGCWRRISTASPGSPSSTTKALKPCAPLWGKWVEPASSKMVVPAFSALRRSYHHSPFEGVGDHAAAVLVHGEGLSRRHVVEEGDGVGLAVDVEDLDVGALVAQVLHLDPGPVLVVDHLVGVPVDDRPGLPCDQSCVAHDEVLASCPAAGREAARWRCRGGIKEVSARRTVNLLDKRRPCRLGVGTAHGCISGIRQSAWSYGHP